MPGFKASEDRLALSLGANVAADSWLRPVLAHHLKTLGPSAGR